MNDRFKLIVKDFITLTEYKPGNFVRFNGIKDYKVSEYIILRRQFGNYYVLFLFNGSMITIPWEWIDLFSSMNVSNGNEIKYIMQSPLREEEDDVVTMTGLRFFGISEIIGRSFSRFSIDSDKFIEFLSEIGNTGTTDFRDWIDSEFGLKLPNLEFDSIDYRKNL